MELAHQDRLAEELDVDLPSDWPPEYHDADTLGFTRKALEAPDAVGWWLHYIVLTDVTRPTLVGVAGYKGPPADGVAEIGYSIVASWQRRGLATEASRALIEAAWQRGATVILAHTLPHLQPSIGVLRKLEFVPSQPPEPGVLAFALHRDTRGALHAHLDTNPPRSSDDRNKPTHARAQASGPQPPKYGVHVQGAPRRENPPPPSMCLLVNPSPTAPGRGNVTPQAGHESHDTAIRQLRQPQATRRQFRSHEERT